MTDQEYKRRLGQVLSLKNPEALRTFLEESAARYGDERQVETIRAKDAEEMVALMHRMITSRADLAHLHAESQRWLQVGQTRLRSRTKRRRDGQRE